MNKEGKATYKVVLNFSGEVLTFFTYAHSKAQARQSAYSQLARKLKVNTAYVSVRMRQQQEPNIVRC
jgi:hypothetical protein